MSIDWGLVSSLATAAGTLVLGVATFASVRSANRAARAAEGSLLAGLRPLLVASRLQDAPIKAGFADQHWVHIEGGHGVADVTAEAIYFAISVRNVGSGIAVLHAWRFDGDLRLGVPAQPDAGSFRTLTRDMYIAPNDNGFWQGAFRDPATEEFARARQVVTDRQRFAIDVLYGDAEGGQRSITRFILNPVGEADWLASMARHWNVDRPAPR